MSNLGAKYLHVAILIPVGEDVPLNVSERRSPGQNSRVQSHICCLQVRRGINVCGLECKSECITVQQDGVYYCICSIVYLINRSGLAKQRILLTFLLLILRYVTT